MDKHSGYLIKDGCISCHDAHWSDNKNLFPSVSHPPVASSECDSCHTTSLGLVSSLSGLCFDCHDDTEFRKYYKHSPYAQGKCMLCHTQHMSDNFGLLQMNDIELCRSCHKKVSLNHPRNTKHFKKGAINKKNNKPMVCSSCHNPHSSDNKIYIRGKGCQECHER